MWHNNKSYGQSEGQLGKETGDTFWEAAKLIVSNCHAALKPNGIAVWVAKDFVHNKQIVPFTTNWQRLCESCGFTTLELIRAWLIEDRGSQFQLNGDLVHKRVERKSFFRRLAEKKGSPRIDYEVVLITRKT